MLRHVITRRQHLLLSTNSWSNVQWVPTVLEASTIQASPIPWKSCSRGPHTAPAALASAAFAGQAPQYRRFQQSAESSNATPPHADACCQPTWLLHHRPHCQQEPATAAVVSGHRGCHTSLTASNSCSCSSLGQQHGGQQEPGTQCCGVAAALEPNGQSKSTAQEALPSSADSTFDIQSRQPRLFRMHPDYTDSTPPGPKQARDCNSNSGSFTAPRARFTGSNRSSSSTNKCYFNTSNQQHATICNGSDSATLDLDSLYPDSSRDCGDQDKFSYRGRSSSKARRQQQQQQQQHTDMRSPTGWYPLARGMQRQVIAHVGPTNSGKTHAALSALMATSSGVYCGPLRLLACEIADRLNVAGVPCNLVTGQEVRLVHGARHTACTVEVADLEQPVEVAVIDEIQMISDKSRGWSWTRALLGLPATSVHVCGEPAATDLIAALADQCGDPLTVNSYRRLSPLVVEPRALNSVGAVQQGDCVVAFGRKTLHKLRKSILATGQSSDTSSDSCSDSDKTRSKRCGVGMVYGALPPETRRTQAALFNAGANAWPRYNVMVASDAIGMGLNLNIRRIVFASMHKYDGKELRPLTPSEAKQIAGRAGRYGGIHGAAGYVTCLDEDDLPLLREALGSASTQIAHACLLPRFEQLEQYNNNLTHPLPFHQLLSKFTSSVQLSEPYCLADMSNMISLARVLRHLEDEMDLEEMYTWCISPASADDAAVVHALLTFTTLYVDRCQVTPACIALQVTTPPRSASEMKAAEELFRIYDLYLWLAGRMGPGVFRGRKFIRQQRQQVADLINVALQEMGGIFAGDEWKAAPIRGYKRVVQGRQRGRPLSTDAAAMQGVQKDGRRNSECGMECGMEGVSSSDEDDEAEVVAA